MRSLTLSLLLAMLGPAPASACNCLHSLKTACDEYQAADAVFVGRPLGGLTLARPGAFSKAVASIYRFFSETATIQFEVLERLKGPVSLDGLEANYDLHACTAPLHAGRKYLVYLYQSPDELTLKPCSRTKEIDRDPAELELARRWRDRGQTNGVTGFVTADLADLRLKRLSPTQPVTTSLSITIDGVEETVATGEDGHFTFPFRRSYESVTVVGHPRSIDRSLTTRRTGALGCSQWILYSEVPKGH